MAPNEYWLFRPWEFGTARGLKCFHRHLLRYFPSFLRLLNSRRSRYLTFSLQISPEKIILIKIRFGASHKRDGPFFPLVLPWFLVFASSPVRLKARSSSVGRIEFSDWHHWRCSLGQCYALLSTVNIWNQQGVLSPSRSSLVTHCLETLGKSFYFCRLLIAHCNLRELYEVPCLVFLSFFLFPPAAKQKSMRYVFYFFDRELAIPDSSHLVFYLIYTQWLIYTQA